MQVDWKDSRYWSVEIKSVDGFLISHELIAENIGEVEEMLCGIGIDTSKIVSIDSCHLGYEENHSLFREDFWLDYMSYRLAKEAPNAPLSR